MRASLDTLGALRNELLCYGQLSAVHSRSRSQKRIYLRKIRLMTERSGLSSSEEPPWYDHDLGALENASLPSFGTTPHVVATRSDYGFRNAEKYFDGIVSELSISTL